jgi:hypothetical protein
MSFPLPAEFLLALTMPLISTPPVAAVWSNCRLDKWIEVEGKVALVASMETRATMTVAEIPCVEFYFNELGIRIGWGTHCDDTRKRRYIGSEGIHPGICYGICPWINKSYCGHQC